jgi:hypothetical protein
MTHLERQPAHLVLRRFVRRQAPEVLELMPSNAQIATIQDQADAVCRISVMTEGDTQAYSIHLPESLMVRPVDWRRFAYDHARVAELLSSCVRDNLEALGSVLFEPRPLSDEQREGAEATLRLALSDLSSIFDVNSVRCESGEDGAFLVTVAGEHKNGETRSYCVCFQL